MMGKIIDIRVVDTPCSDEAEMIASRKESLTLGTINSRTADRKGMVYLLIDCSGSMDGHKMSQAKKGILEFARDAIKKEYSVGLIKFDTSATHICEPKCDAGELTSHLDNMDAHGSTNMAAAIAMGHGHLGDTGYARVMVIATDGRPDKAQSALQAGQDAKNDGIDIITIGTDDADLGFLKKLATSVELGNKVSAEHFGKAIASAHLQLPDPGQIDRSKILSHEPGRSLQFPGLRNYSFSKQSMAF